MAYPFLQLASLTTTSWLALRLCDMEGSDAHAGLAALGRHWLRIALPLARAEAARVEMGEGIVEEFAAAGGAFSE